MKNECGDGRRTEVALMVNATLLGVGDIFAPTVPVVMSVAVAVAAVALTVAVLASRHR